MLIKGLFGALARCHPQRFIGAQPEAPNGSNCNPQTLRSLHGGLRALILGRHAALPGLLRRILKAAGTEYLTDWGHPPCYSEATYNLFVIVP